MCLTVFRMNPRRCPGRGLRPPRPCVSRTIGLLLFLMLIPTMVPAYSNPVLKVLLLETRQRLLFDHLGGVGVSGTNGRRIKIRRLAVEALDGDRLRLNGQTWTGTAMISASGPIELREPGTTYIRRYLGQIEIRPFADGYYVINHIPTETYLEGVLNAEIDSNWPIEVVKAQSIISRTFALFKRHQRREYAWHLSASHFDQVYKGVNIADARGQFAIGATRGIVVAYQGKLAQTFYHSNCGGVTEDPRHIWQVNLPYLRSRVIPYGRSDPRYRWQAEIDRTHMIRILRTAGHRIGRIEDVFVSRRAPSGRVMAMTFVGEETVILSGYDFRRHAGNQRIQSLLFEMIETPRGFFFKGRGNGHGVGLSQWAAKEMAEQGFSYEDILRYFYVGIEVGRYNG